MSARPVDARTVARLLVSAERVIDALRARTLAARSRRPAALVMMTVDEVDAIATDYALATRALAHYRAELRAMRAHDTAATTAAHHPQTEPAT